VFIIALDILLVDMCLQQLLVLRVERILRELDEAFFLFDVFALIIFVLRSSGLYLLHYPPG